jgi:adenylosuccinate synthase
MNEKRQAIFIADLGFGDAGKGTITDFLTRELTAHTIVRYNGGPQAGHTVITPDGKSHTFAQFGSGLFLPATKTLLSRFMLVNPFNMMNEAIHLHDLGVKDVFERTLIDRRALVITPFQKHMNRLREVARGVGRHGSCGEGISECMTDYLKYGDAVLCIGDLQDRATVIKKLRLMHKAKLHEIDEICGPTSDRELIKHRHAALKALEDTEFFADSYQSFSGYLHTVDDAEIQSLFAKPGTILFEGAQGVMLDENYGFAPYTTWSTTTFANADTLVQEHDYTGEIIKLGVVRAYATRHGAGPFPTEDHALAATLPDQHNPWNNWQHTFRVGYFDAVATRYARDVVGELDYLAVTNVDRLEAIPEWKICHAYNYQGAGEDLSTYFELERERLTSIKLPPSIDLSHQEKLTSRLWLCKPEYQSLSPGSGTRFSEEDKAAYLSLIEKSLSIPIAITSHGPTALDKQCSQDFKGRISQ